MKVYMKKNITAYSGLDRDEHVVYNSFNEGNVCTTRKTFEYVPTAHTAVFSDQMNHIQDLWNLAGNPFKAELKKYEIKRRKLYLNNQLRGGGNYGIFLKMIFAYAKAQNADVLSLQIVDLKQSSIKSIAEAVNAEILPKVDGYELMTAVM